jgi:hypothetical protein
MQKANPLKTFVGSKLVWPFAALILILLFNLFFTPGFFSWRSRMAIYLAASSTS